MGTSSHHGEMAELMRVYEDASRARALLLSNVTTPWRKKFAFTSASSRGTSCGIR